MLSMIVFYHVVDVNDMIRKKYRSRKTSSKPSMKVSLKTSLNNPIKADILVASNFDDET